MCFQNISTPNQAYLFKFIIFLAYKYELIGKHLIKIDEIYTFKEFYVYGTRNDILLWEITMNFDCENFINRDRTSSINIMKRLPTTKCFVDKLSIFW